MTTTLARPPTGQDAPRLILLEERDVSIGLDRDGCPHTAGKLWLIPTASIAAVEVVPENTRGIVVKIHVRGQKAPIVPCDPDAVLEALGARVGSVLGGHLVWAPELDEEEVE